MKIEIILSFIVAMILSALLVPIVKIVGDKLNIIALQNERTIHNGRIVRIGGYAIYISFIICAYIFLKTDVQINSILFSSFLVFMIGLYDDIHDVSPKVKLLVEIIAASIIIFYGKIMLRGFTIPYLPGDICEWISIGITYLWIIGITNAINLIDGLDGLSSGISTIVLVTLSLTSLHFGRTDIAALSLLLAGATVGFLFYNFNPASIFMGDNGALFLGFMISVISLLGFGYKSSAFFTLGAPIIVLAVPIMDTIMAILRRKLRKKKFSDADREHLHHQLMFNLNLGQKKSVLILYGATVLFSLSSYIYLFDKKAAIALFVLLVIAFELFVEYTQMISRRYRPLLTIINLFVHSDKLPVLSEPEPDVHTLKELSTQINKENKQQIDYYRRRARAYERTKRIMKKDSKSKLKLQILIVSILSVCVVFGVVAVMYLKNQGESNQPPVVQPVDDGLNYTLSTNATDKMKEIFEQLEAANQSGDQEKEMTYAAAYFATDFFTWSNKTKREDIGGLNYVWPDSRQDFASFALRDYYANFTDYANKYGISLLPEVENYVINGVSESEFRLESEEDKDKPCFDISIDITYKQVSGGMPTSSLKSSMVITVVKDTELYYVVGIDYKEA
ncbi:MAG: undecaprenyl/decaprenyl-phosphate alpha-N-acetylglucosaminyl 1-phosphate transferase [Beduini sp.]|uniref:undecaprenyl/decaprenyl-phosphate alpha-N-acetylglucosaminyl 1-phosphate transferase n=1 Tax=Beduini sp. TaxID=1922300 RepID=UPI0011C78DAD